MADEKDEVDYPFICTRPEIFTDLNQTQAFKLSSLQKSAPIPKFDCYYDLSKMDEHAITECANILSIISGYSLVGTDHPLSRVPGFNKDKDIYEICEKIFDRLKVDCKLFFETMSREFLYDGVVMEMIAKGYISKGLLLDFVNLCINSEFIFIFGENSYINILTENAQEVEDEEDV